MDHTHSYMAHGFCFLWEPGLVWLHVLSDIITGISYISIPAALIYFLIKRPDLPFPRMFALFALFILACGVSHLFAAYTVYDPLYWQEGAVKAFTALVSLLAAIMFIPILPQAIALPSLSTALKDIKDLNCTLENQLGELKIKDYALSSSMNAIVFLDLEGTITYVNNSFVRMWGYESDRDVLGTLARRLWQSDDEAMHVREAVKNRSYWAGEMTARRKDGTLFPASLTANTIISEKGEPVSHMISCMDVTEQKRAEEGLRESERRMREMLEKIHLLAVMLDRNGNVLFANDHLLAVTGWTRDDVIGTNWFRRFTPFETGIEEMFKRALKEGSIPSHHENVIATAAGRTLTVVWNNTILRDSAGNIMGATAIGVDVTEHRKIEEQLRQAQKMEAIGELAGGVAHDFNNVLSAIVGYAHLGLLKMREDDPNRHNVKQILEASERASVLTQGLLAYSRKQAIHLAIIDLNEVIEKFEKFLLRLVREDIELKTVHADQHVMVMADRGQIEQVLMNLVTNARDAMPKGGRIIISAARVHLDEFYVRNHSFGQPGDYALLSVTDTGSGIPENIREKVYDPFFTTKEEGKGTGLGLSMVYGIVKKHQGYIDLYSQTGIGTTFKIYLPLTNAGVVEQQPGEEQIVLPRGTETVLIAEDDLSVRNMASTLLRDYGYTVIEAADGLDAVNKFAENRENVSLIIVDGIMPKMNGREAWQEIKVLAPAIKTIFVSGYAEDIFEKEQLPAKGTAFIQKPYLPSILLRKIRDVLDRDGQRPA